MARRIVLIRSPQEESDDSGAPAPALSAPLERSDAATIPAVKSTNRWLAPVLTLCGIGLLIALVSRFPLARIGEAWSTMGWPVVFAPVIALAWFAANSSGMHALLGGRVPWRFLFINRLVGEGYNALTPFAGMGGEPFKVRHLTRYLRADEAVAIVVVDRIVTTLSSLLFSGCFITASIVTVPWPSRLLGWGIAYVCFAFVGALALTLLGLSRGPQRLGVWIRKLFGQPASFSAPPQVNPQAFLVALGWHVLGRAIMILEIVLLLHLLEIPYGIWIVVAITSMVATAGVLAFLIPQSLGVAEGASVLAFQLVGYPLVLGIAFGLVIRGRALVVSILGVTVHLAERTYMRYQRRPSPAVQTGSRREGLLHGDMCSTGVLVANESTETTPGRDPWSTRE